MKVNPTFVSQKEDTHTVEMPADEHVHLKTIESDLSDGF